MALVRLGMSGHPFDVVKITAAAFHNPISDRLVISDPDTKEARPLRARDMAFVLYTRWKFPVDWRFYSRAPRFRGHKKRDWEGTGPVA